MNDKKKCPFCDWETKGTIALEIHIMEKHTEQYWNWKIRGEKHER
jgi:hypothetical protein